MKSFIVLLFILMANKQSVWAQNPLQAKLCALDMASLTTSSSYSFKNRKIIEILNNKQLARIYSAAEEINAHLAKNEELVYLHMPSTFEYFSEVRSRLHEELAKYLKIFRIRYFHDAFLDKINDIQSKDDPRLNLKLVHDLIFVHGRFLSDLELLNRGQSQEMFHGKFVNSAEETVKAALRDSKEHLSYGENLSWDGFAMIPSYTFGHYTRIVGNWALGAKALLFSTADVGLLTVHGDSNKTIASSIEHDYNHAYYFADRYNGEDGKIFGAQATEFSRGEYQSVDKLAYWDFLLMQTFEIESYLKNIPGMFDLDRTYLSMHHLLFDLWHEQVRVPFHPKTHESYLKKIISKDFGIESMLHEIEDPKPDDAEYIKLAAKIIISSIEKFKSNSK